MKKIELTKPYLLVERVNTNQTESGLAFVETENPTEILLGKVIQVYEGSNFKPGDVVLYIKERAFRFVYELNEYFIISETEDIAGKI